MCVYYDIDYVVGKTLGLRVFNNKEGKFDFSIQDVYGELLVVSQFTLYANTQKGKRPSFTTAMPPIKSPRLPSVSKFIGDQVEGIDIGV